MIKKIVGGLMLPILIAGSGCGIAYGIKYKQVNDAYILVNGPAIKNENNELKVKIERLNEKVSLLESTITQITSELENEKNLSKEQVADLKSKLDTSNQELEKAKQLIEQLKRENMFLVMFTLNDELYSAQQVLIGENCQVIDTPVVENFEFLGWAVKGTNDIVDPFSMSITEDIEFVAILKRLSYALTTEDFNLLFNDEEKGINLRNALKEGVDGKSIESIASVKYIEYVETDSDGYVGCVNVYAQTSQLGKSIITYLSVPIKTSEIVDEFLLNCGNFDCKDYLRFEHLLDDTNQDALTKRYKFNATFVNSENGTYEKEIIVSHEYIFLNIGEIISYDDGYISVKKSSAIVISDENDILNFGVVSLGNVSTNKTPENGLIKYISLNYVV